MGMVNTVQAIKRFDTTMEKLATKLALILQPPRQTEPHLRTASREKGACLYQVAENCTSPFVAVV